MAEDWLADVRKYAANADETVVRAIVRHCGIALQNRDSSLVSFSDKTETDRVRENFLKKKLGLTDPDASLDSAIAEVGQIMKADRTKNRVTVYYLLAEKFGQLGLFGGAPAATVADTPPVAPLAAAGLAGAGLAGAGLAGAGLAGAAGAAASAAPQAAPASPTPPSGFGDLHGGALHVGEEPRAGWRRWLPWLLAALVIVGLFLVVKSCNTDKVTIAQSKINETVVTEVVPVPAVVIPTGAGVIADMRDSLPILTVYFETGKSDVSNDLAAAALGLKTYLEKNPTATLAVSGYNDPTGNAAANAALSKTRAQEVSKALALTGIPAASITLQKPAETTDTSDTLAQARRVEVVVKP